MQQFSGTFMDAPATTSAVTYKMQVAAVDAGRMNILDNGQRIPASEPIPEGRTVVSETIDTTTSRLYLQKGIYNEFLDKLTERAKKIKIAIVELVFHVNF